MTRVPPSPPSASSRSSVTSAASEFGVCLGLAVVGSTMSNGVVFASGIAGVVFRGGGVVFGFLPFGFLEGVGFLGAFGFLVGVGFLGALVGFWGFGDILGSSESSGAGVGSSGLFRVSSVRAGTLGTRVVAFTVVFWGDVVS